MAQTLIWKVERVLLDVLEVTLNALDADGWTIFAVLGPDPGGGHPVIVCRPDKK